MDKFGTQKLNMASLSYDILQQDSCQSTLVKGYSQQAFDDPGYLNSVNFSEQFDPNTFTQKYEFKNQEFHFLQNNQTKFQQKILEQSNNNQIQVNDFQQYNQWSNQQPNSNKKEYTFQMLNYENSENEISQDVFNNTYYEDIDIQSNNYLNYDLVANNDYMTSNQNNLALETQTYKNFQPNTYQQQKNVKITEINNDQLEKKNVFNQTEQQFLNQLAQKEQQNQQKLQKKKEKKYLVVEQESKMQKNMQKERQKNFIGEDKYQETKNLASNACPFLFEEIKMFHPQIKSIQDISLQGFNNHLIEQIDSLPQNEQPLFKQNMKLLVNTSLIKKALDAKTFKTHFIILKYKPALEAIIQNPGKFNSFKQAQEFVIQEKIKKKIN